MSPLFNMDSLSPYEQLQVSEDASFEEVQSARDRLVATLAGNVAQQEKIEAAYDAVLMDRLRQRQEGKIKVPERIRFAEKIVAEAAKRTTMVSPAQRQPWMRPVWDRPTVAEAAWPGGVYTTLIGVSLYASMGLAQAVDPKLLLALSNNLAFLLAIGVGFSVYWLNHKEQRLGRAFLFTLVGVIGAAVLGAVLLQVAGSTLAVMPIITWVTVIIFVVLWVITSFLR